MIEEKAATDKVQLVLFTIGAEDYGLDVGQVQEIVRPLPVTRVPRAPACIEGVINLRGNIIPVINVHNRLGCPCGENGHNTRIIIACCEEVVIGLIVDEVKGVTYIERGSIESPAALEQLQASYWQGIAKQEGRLILLLDLASILADAGSTIGKEH